MEAKLKRKRVSWRRLTTVLAILIVSFMAGYGAMAYFLTGDSPIPGRANPLSTTDYGPGERINLLLLGTDARPGEKDSRTDSIIVASIEPASKKAALVSIPRDTLAELPGHGKDKINSANVLGGVSLTKETVEQLLDIKIDHYLKTNFDGFSDIIDTLGGVTIDVEKDMRYRDPTDGTNINLKKGVQELTGKTALDYARFRHDSLGDISRTQRQQKLLKAIAREALQAKTVLKLPALIPQISKAVETDLSVPQMIKLATLAKDLENLQVVAQTLPGQFYNNHGSYWKADEEQAKQVLNNMLNGVQSEVVVGPDINVSKKATRTAKADIKKKPTVERVNDPNPGKLSEKQQPYPDDANQNGNNSGTAGTGGTVDNSGQPAGNPDPGQGSQGATGQGASGQGNQGGINQGGTNSFDQGVNPGGAQNGASNPSPVNQSGGGQSGSQKGDTQPPAQPAADGA